MAESCRISPVVFQRKGTRVEETDSRLFKDIKEAVEDRELAWELWALTKTPVFKENHGGLELDELGEVKFSSLIKELGLQDAYDRSKSSKIVAKEHGINGKVYADSSSAMAKVNEINSQEKRHVAFAEKAEGGYAVRVVPRDAQGIQRARHQSYNNALTGELIDLLQSMGFNVSFLGDPKYAGLFDPEHATLEDGLMTIIRLAAGERGEKALPEEFSHMIIEGLADHPLVQRLLASLDSSQITEVLGDYYEDYYKQYRGDFLKLKKEAAGKLLSEYIEAKGTIKPKMMEEKRSLLSRIWQWAKGMFSKITRNQMDSARERAYMSIAGIYNLIASGEAVSLINRTDILQGSSMYKMDAKYSDMEHLANAAVTTNAKMLQIENRSKLTKRQVKNSHQQHMKMRELHEEGDIDSQVKSLEAFLNDTNERLVSLNKRMNELQDAENKGTLTGMQKAREFARLNRKVTEFIDGYEEIVETIGNLDQEDNMAQMKIDKAQATLLSDKAKRCRDDIGVLRQFARVSSLEILLDVCRTQYGEDTTIGIGSRRNEVMSLKEILEHADKDINVIDRWFSSLSDASDPLLTLFDGIVKNQQYERDMELLEYNNKIAKLDEDLRKAGYTSDFIYEKDAFGVPTGRIISEYDWDTYNKERMEKVNELRELQREKGFSDTRYYELLKKWQYGEDRRTGVPRLVKKYVDPKLDELYKKGKRGKKYFPEDAVFEMVPNPEYYDKNKNRLDSLPEAQRTYYNAMLTLKREMMLKIPHRGQAIYRAPYISKDFVEGILDNTTGNIVQATADHYLRKFTRRPDDIGFGTSEDFPEEILQILKDEKDPKKAAEEILKHLSESVEDDILNSVSVNTIEKYIARNQENLEVARDKIVSYISSERFYLVETDFANHRIQKLPVYYTRPLKRDKNGSMPMLSTDFSGAMTAYTAMALNYEKMDEVVDILEVGRNYVNDRRVIRENNKGIPLRSKYQAMGKIYRSIVEEAGTNSNIAGRLNDYIDSTVYEERKKKGKDLDILGVNLNVDKTLDAIKDYTGLLSLGFNVFSTITNISMGKLQQWIEAAGGEYFTPADYFKAVGQYKKLILGCIMEMGNPLKKNKLSLLIQMFDPMGEYYENLRDPHFSKSAVSRVLGSGSFLAYLGMDAGEHMLRCQTMLAILNHVKLVDMNNPDGKKISLFDALEVKAGEDGIYRLELKEGLAYERDVIDYSKGTYKDTVTGRIYSKNPNYGKPVKDENGRIKTEKVPLENIRSEAAKQFIIKKKRVIRKVNNSLNGAFHADDKGPIHRIATGRLIMQFRQWMPAHYERRFAGAHYDNDLEQWREGFYVTMGKLFTQMAKDMKKGSFEWAKVKDGLSEHEKANLRRATTEIGLFMMMATLIKIGGRVKDRDRSWLNKMVLYQLHRMKLELGASSPIAMGDFFKNIFTLLQSPAPALTKFQQLGKVFNFWNMFDEVQTGRYQGWSEWARDSYQLVPVLPQIDKAIDFDDSMFSMFEQDN